MIIEIFDTQKDLSLSHIQIKHLVKEILDFQKVTVDEVGIHLISNEEMCHLHKVHFNDSSPTDCISFPLEQIDAQKIHSLGDVYVCPFVAMTYASQSQSSAYQEVTLYILHGLLHLLGVDDIDEHVKEMRRLEALNMENLRLKKLILRKD